MIDCGIKKNEVFGFFKVLKKVKIVAHFRSMLVSLRMFEKKRLKKSGAFKSVTMREKTNVKILFKEISKSWNCFDSLKWLYRQNCIRNCYQKFWFKTALFNVLLHTKNGYLNFCGTLGHICLSHLTSSYLIHSLSQRNWVL